MEGQRRRVSCGGREIQRRKCKGGEINGGRSRGGGVEVDWYR